MSLLESSWKTREEVWEIDLPFPELLKRTVSMKNDFFDQIDLDNFWALINSNPDIKKLIDDFNKNRYPHIVSKFIEKGRREGYIRKDISIETATIYLTMYMDVIQKYNLQKNENKALLKELLNLMIYGLVGQSIDG